VDGARYFVNSAFARTRADPSSTYSVRLLSLARALLATGVNALTTRCSLLAVPPSTGASGLRLLLRVLLPCSAVGHLAWSETPLPSSFPGDLALRLLRIPLRSAHQSTKSFYGRPLGLLFALYRRPTSLSSSVLARASLTGATNASPEKDLAFSEPRPGPPLLGLGEP
jgi:hypothetical protein